MWVHVLRNASIPIITHVMSALPGLLVGAFLIERFFSIPGIGREVILAVERSDFPVIKALTVYVAVATMLVNLLADLMYKAVDPRVAMSAAAEVRRSASPRDCDDDAVPARAPIANDAAIKTVAPPRDSRTPSPPACGRSPGAASCRTASRWYRSPS